MSKLFYISTEPTPFCLSAIALINKAVSRTEMQAANLIFMSLILCSLISAGSFAAHERKEKLEKLTLERAVKQLKSYLIKKMRH